MKRWLAGLFVVLLLIGTCGKDEGADTGGGAERYEEAVQESDAADRAAAREARRLERRLRRDAAARRARARRARARRAAAAVAAEAERIAAEEAAAEEVVAQEAAPSCDSNYAGACLDPNSADYDCEGGSGDGPDYVGTVQVIGSDPHDLDRDGDGTACDA